MKKGFTLIELLVSISIIGVLASMLLVNIVGFRVRARDTDRKKDLLQIQTALELYRSDVSSYPGSLPACNASLSNGTTVYMRNVPCDPLNPTSVRYTYNMPGGSYTLYACLENQNDTERDSSNQPGCTVASYTVNSP